MKRSSRVKRRLKDRRSPDRIAFEDGFYAREDGASSSTNTYRKAPIMDISARYSEGYAMLSSQKHKRAQWYRGYKCARGI